MAVMDTLIRWVTGREPERAVMPPWAPGQDNFLNSVLMNGVTYSLNQTLGGTSEPIGADFIGLVQGAYQRNGIVYACSAARLMLLSQARFQWQRMVKGEPGELWGNADLGILERPEPGKVTADMLARASLDIDYSGNAFIARRVIAGGVQLKRLRPDWTDILVGTNGGGGTEDIDAEVLGYVYYPGGRWSGYDPELLLRETVAHIAPIPDPLHRFRGMSWITPIIRDIQGDTAATAHKDAFFANGATVNMIVQTGLTAQEPDKFDKWVKRFNEGHAGIRNAYKTLFLTTGADATPVGSNFQEMDFSKTQAEGETRIAVASGMHPVIIGISEGLQGSSLNQGNFMAARRLVADMTLRPWWGSFSASMEVIAPPPSGSRLWYDERHIPFLAEDVKDSAEVQSLEAQTIRTLVDAGYKPESVTAAITSHDWTRLVHTDLFSVQLQPPGTTATPAPAEGPMNGQAGEAMPAAAEA